MTSSDGPATDSEDEPESTPRAPRAPLFTSGFVLAWFANFFQYLTFYFLVTTMALYAVKEFAASDAAGGFASSAFVVGATAARLFTGYIVDRFGSRRVMIISLIIATVACGLYLPAGSLPLLIAMRLLHGFAYAFVSTAVMAIVQAGIPPLRRAEGTGYFALGSTVAAAIGPAFGLAIVGAFDYRTLFWVALMTAIAGLAFGVFIRTPGSQPAAPDPSPHAVDRPRFSLRRLLHPAVVPIGVFMVIVGTCYAGVITYINAYAEERDVVAGAGLFFVAYAVTMFLLRFVLGRLQDRRGDNVVVYFGLVMFAAGFVVLWVAHSNALVVIAGACMGLGYGTLMPAAQAIAVNAVGPNELGTGISTLLLLADLGFGLGPVLLGVLLSFVDYGTMFGILAGVVAVSALVYTCVHGRHPAARRRLA